MEIVIWDWKAQPDFEWLNEEISKFTNPTLIPVVTWGDFYAVVVCERGTSQDDAQKALENWRRRQEE